MSDILTLDSWREILLHVHHQTLSWAVTGEFFHLNKATARLIAKGYRPGPRIAHKLGILEKVNVTVVSGEVAPGAQVVGSVCCSCGADYVSNNPARSKCYLCAPASPASRKARRVWTRTYDSGHAGGEWR